MVPRQGGAPAFISSDLERLEASYDESRLRHIIRNSEDFPRDQFLAALFRSERLNILSDVDLYLKVLSQDKDLTNFTRDQALSACKSYMQKNPTDCSRVAEALSAYALRSSAPTGIRADIVTVLVETSPGIGQRLALQIVKEEGSPLDLRYKAYRALNNASSEFLYAIAESLIADPIEADLEVQRAIMIDLCKLNSARSGELLLTYIQRRDSNVVVVNSMVLSHGTNSCLEHVLPLVAQNSKFLEETRAGALSSAISLAADREVPGWVIAILEDPSVSIRLRAQSYVYMADKQNSAGNSYLLSLDPERCDAVALPALAILHNKNEMARDAIARRARIEVSTEPHSPAREFAVSTLSLIADPEDLDLMMGVLDNSQSSGLELASAVNYFSKRPDFRASSKIYHSIARLRSLPYGANFEQMWFDCLFVLAQSGNYLAVCDLIKNPPYCSDKLQGRFIECLETRFRYSLKDIAPMLAADLAADISQKKIDSSTFALILFLARHDQAKAIRLCLSTAQDRAKDVEEEKSASPFRATAAQILATQLGPEGAYTCYQALEEGKNNDLRLALNIISDKGEGINLGLFLKSLSSYAGSHDDKRVKSYCDLLEKADRIGVPFALRYQSSLLTHLVENHTWNNWQTRPEDRFVIFAPHSDWNGAFCQTKYLMQLIREGKKIAVRAPKSQTELIAVRADIEAHGGVWGAVQGGHANYAFQTIVGDDPAQNPSVGDENAIELRDEQALGAHQIVIYGGNFLVEGCGSGLGGPERNNLVNMWARIERRALVAGPYEPSSIGWLSFSNGELQNVHFNGSGTYLARARRATTGDSKNTFAHRE